MKYWLEIDPSVNREAARIYRYREVDKKGTGENFLNALNDCYDSILDNPLGCQLRKDPFRHALLHRLKYRVVFKVDGSIVLVVQLRHTSRKVSKKFGP